MKSRKLPDAEKIEKVRARCRRSLYWCAWYLCGFTELSQILHLGLEIWFNKGLRAGHKWFLCLVPRGHFKTSFLHIALIVHALINNPNVRILVIMHNSDMAREKGRKLREVLKSEPMRTYFGDLIPAGELGTMTEFTVNRSGIYAEPSVKLAGIATGVTGGHFDIIIVDDAIEFKAAQSEVVMATAVNFLQTINPLFEDENSLLIILGTLWPGGENGWYETLLRNERFHRLVLGCDVDERFNAFLELVGLDPGLLPQEYIDERVLEPNRELRWEDGQPIFPERRTVEGLARDKETMGEYVYSHQMLNILIPEGTRKFRREDFGEYSLEYGRSAKPARVIIDGVSYPWSRGVVTAALDPTGGMSKDTDKAGMTVCWWLPPMKLGCLCDWWHGVAEPHRQIELFLEMGAKWNVDFLIVEKDAMQVWVEQWLIQEMRRRGEMFHVKPFQSRGQRKGFRILDRFQPYVAAHQFYVLQPEHEPVVSHLCNLNIGPDGKVIGESPALADTFPMHVEYWYATDEDRTLNPHAVWDQTGDSDRVDVRPISRPRYGLAPSRKLRLVR